MLCQIIEGMIDPEPSKRPQKAAHVAKSLRVFLAAEEHAQEGKAEEHIVAPHEKAAEAMPVEPQTEDEVEEEEEQPAPRRPQLAREPVAQEGAWGKAVALWQELKPELRDLLFFAAGALVMLFLIFLVEILTGIRLTYVAGLFTGMAASYCAELFLRWRRQRAESVTG